MVQYETIMILHDSLNEKQCKSVAEDYVHIIRNIFMPEVKKLKVDLMGKKTLSYKIKSCTEGWYILFTYNVEHDDPLESPVSNLERVMRIDEKIIKFMTVRRTEDLVDISGNDIANIDQSEQPDNKNIDAMDVLLGLASYSKKGV